MITKRQARTTAAQDLPARDAPTRDLPDQVAPDQDLPAQAAPTGNAPAKAMPTQNAPAKDVSTQDAPAQATPTLIAVRHPGHWPLAFGPYATGGVIHQVDRITAARLLARGFELVGTDDGAAGSSAIPHAIPNSPAHEV